MQQNYNYATYQLVYHMKNRVLLFLLSVCPVLTVSGAVGDLFVQKGIQYKVTAEGNANYEVSAVRYDSSYIIMPDSVSYGPFTYAVTDAIYWYNPNNCSLRQYDKIDLSAAKHVTNLPTQLSGLIAIDTLILPPSTKQFSSSSFRTTDSLDATKFLINADTLLPGIHRVYSTGTQSSPVVIKQCTSIIEADLSSYTATYSTGSSFAKNPFLKKLLLPNTMTIWSEGVFRDDKCLAEVSVPDSLEKIYWPLGEILMPVLKVPAKTYEIDPGFDWYALTRIEVDSANPYYMDEDGVLYTKDQSVLWCYPDSRPGGEYHLSPHTETIKMFAFRVNEKKDAKLKKLVFNSSLENIEWHAFINSSITHYVDFQYTQVKTIPLECFRGSNIESIALPEGLEEIGHRAFANTPNLKKLGSNIAQSIHTISPQAFLEAVELEELDFFDCRKLYDIPEMMCKSDSSLTYVGLPRNVKTIGKEAFKGCVALEQILCPSPNPIPIDASVFDGVDKRNCTLVVPVGSVDKYKAANVWKQFFNIVGDMLYYMNAEVSDTLAGSVIGGGVYQKGETATLAAIPNKGYEFVSWSDKETVNPRLIKMTKDVALTAIFAPIQIDLATTWYGVERYQPAEHTGAEPQYKAVRYYVEGTKLMHGKKCHALWRNEGELCAGIRMSEDKQQVYICPTENLLQDPWWENREYLLYDFDVELGDTVYAFDGSYAGIDSMGIDWPNQYMWVVEGVEKIDKRRHVYVIGGQMKHQAEWIEGIGTKHVLFENNYEDASGGVTSTYALCAADSAGNILYSFDTRRDGIRNNCPDWEIIEALDHVPSDTYVASKILRNGQLFIRRGDKTYTAAGLEIK